MLRSPTLCFPDIDVLVNSAVDKHRKAAEATVTSVSAPSLEGAAMAHIFVPPSKKEQLNV